MTVMLVKGGPSLEYDVSLRSAALIRKTLENLGHEVREVLIPRDGELPRQLFCEKCDLVWPVTHGRLGEDGCLQGLFECLRIPYASEDVATSALGMDKDLQLRLFSASGIPCPRTVTLTGTGNLDQVVFSCDEYIVKMCCGGSSIGVRKCTRSTLAAAVESVLEMDERVLVQECVTPLRELECLVLCREDGEIMVLGPVEVMAGKPYYIYENKYSSSTSCVPAELDSALGSRLKDYAIKAFRAVHGSLYMRVDFFLSGSKLMINEINTIPGATATSHIIPLSGWIGGMENLVSVIISAALERHRQRQEKTGR